MYAYQPYPYANTGASFYPAQVPVRSFVPTTSSVTVPAAAAAPTSSVIVQQPQPQPLAYQPFVGASYQPHPFPPQFAQAASYYGGQQPVGSYYGQPFPQQQAQQRGLRSAQADVNRGYYYDDYIHDRHSPRRSYAAFRDARMPVPEGDIIYRHAIQKEDDFVLPRRSPRSEAIAQQQQLKQQQQQQSTQPQQAQPAAAAVPRSTTATIEVVEAKEIPTSILDKTDPYVKIVIGGKTFKTTPKDDAGKAARWNESFTVESVRAGAEGTIEIRDKDTLKDDAIASATFVLENGDRWYSLKPKGQVRLNVKGVY